MTINVCVIIHMDSDFTFHVIIIYFFFCLQFLAETLDVVQDIDWVISLGNAFAKQYELYTYDDEHSALLHRYELIIIIITFF